MTNKQRQPVVQKAYPGNQRYADATTNSVVGKNARVETIPVDDKVDAKPDIAPEADLQGPF